MFDDKLASLQRGYSCSASHYDSHQIARPIKGKSSTATRSVLAWDKIIDALTQSSLVPPGWQSADSKHKFYKSSLLSAKSLSSISQNLDVRLNVMYKCPIAFFTFTFLVMNSTYFQMPTHHKGHY